MAERLPVSLKKWVLPVIGTENVLQWMRAVLLPFRRFLLIFIKKGLSIKVQEL